MSEIKPFNNTEWRISLAEAKVLEAFITHTFPRQHKEWMEAFERLCQALGLLPKRFVIDPKETNELLKELVK